MKPINHKKDGDNDLWETGSMQTLMTVGIDTDLRRRLGGWFHHIAEDTLPARLAVWQLRNSIQDEF